MWEDFLKEKKGAGAWFPHELRCSAAQRMVSVRGLETWLIQGGFCEEGLKPSVLIVAAIVRGSLSILVV